jgi:hypothetical protein
MDQEVSMMIAKKAVELTGFHPEEFVSNLFLVPKKNGQMRPVINLRPLNYFVRKIHFKMETIETAICLLRVGDFLATIDLKDAYFSVPIAESHRKFLRFIWRNQRYQFRCLPFGLTSSPRIFTKVLKPVVAALRRQGIRLVIFLDDILIMSPTKEVCHRQVKIAVQLLTNLGFVINLKKSCLMPTQEVEFLGFVLDSRNMLIKISTQKCARIIEECKKMLLKKVMAVREVASCVGLLKSVIHAILPATMFCRHLQQAQIVAMRKSKLSYDAEMSLSMMAREELRLWIERLHIWNGRPVVPPPIDCMVQTDASIQGWGGVKGHQEVSGRWSAEDRTMHINVLEARAVRFVLLSLFRQVTNVHIRLQIDNAAVVAYVNHQGGTKSLLLNKEVLEMWKWCFERRILISAEHLPGKLNVTADRLSRVFQDHVEWSLHPRMFQLLIVDLGIQPDVDLFASRINKQIPRFVSWHPDPLAWRVDALVFQWDRIKPYMFPPFCLVGRVLEKVRRDRVKVAVLVAPVWDTQPWYADLLLMLIQQPVIFPRRSDLLTLPHNGEKHPLSHKLRLAGWLISGHTSSTLEFRQRQRLLSWLPGEEVLRNSTRPPGEFGIAGVVDGVLIPFRQL